MEGALRRGASELRHEALARTSRAGSVSMGKRRARGVRGAQRMPVTFDEGWARLQPTIDRGLEACERGWPDTRKLDNKEHTSLYQVVYDMCTQKKPNNHSDQLYTRYSAVLTDYLTDRVLPQLKELEAATLLDEIGRRWAHYRRLVQWLRFFNYLNRFHTKRQKLPSLGDVAVTVFKRTILPLVEGDHEAALHLQELFGAETDDPPLAGGAKRERLAAASLQPTGASSHRAELDCAHDSAASKKIRRQAPGASCDCDNQ